MVGLEKKKKTYIFEKVKAHVGLVFSIIAFDEPSTH